MGAIWDHIAQIFDTLIEYLKLAYYEVLGFILSGAMSLLEAAMGPDITGDPNVTISDKIESLWAAIPTEWLGMINVLNIPDAMAIIMTAWITRFVIRLIMPGIG
ncbi:DUF2523 family protein [Magnetofaba australis]|uniref:DUF2523 family protein n=1 Tax=Magnetofaba australis TaxID=1472297 RepID=UPI000A19F7FD|nr:DUF2523 family protein [Magnetofaba australis]